MLRFVLLMVFPMVVFANPQAYPTNRAEYVAMMETHMKPCIVDGVNCPSGSAGMDFGSFAPVVRQMRGYRLPAECSCNTQAESCNRACYYAFMLKSYRQSILSGKTDPSEIAASERQIVELFETTYKPCVLENRNCERVGGITYDQIRSQVQVAVQTYTLPNECNYDTETERAVRVCYYAYMVQSGLKAFPSRK